MHLRDDVAQPVSLGEQKLAGNRAVGQKRPVRPGRLRDGKQRLVVLHVVGKDDLGALACESRGQFHRRILGRDHRVGIAKRIQQ
jgi:hypothetical protein